MEYLMTYGWAILIIAVVLGALYYLGVFNSSNLAPRAQPGSCKVVRPNGPGTTTYINLAGVCTGQLPLFVGSFDGQSSYIDVGNKAILNVITNDFTISMWLNSNGWSTSPILVGKESSVSGNPGWDVGVTGSDGKAFIDMNDGTWLRSMHIGSVLSINKWYQIVFV